MPLTDAPTAVLDDSTKRDLIKALWPRQPTTASTLLHIHELDWSAYFDYYSQECEQWCHSNGDYVSVRTHQDILTIAQRIANLEKKEDLRASCRPQFQSPRPASQEDNMVEASINLATRLLVMLDIGKVPYAYSGRIPLDWKSDTLQKFVKVYFTGPTRRNTDNFKLDKIFIAHNFGRFAGLEIEWTDNLADHLLLVDDDQKVRLFHHVSFLTWQQSTIFPPGLMEETLKTLKLLFPQSNDKSRKWLESLIHSRSDASTIDRQLLKCGQLREQQREIDEFYFWYDRLVILKRVFDQSQRKGLKQWWTDRRNAMQWWTFWVALLVLFLTIFFGLVQSIEGALQVYKAYHPTGS